MSFSFVVEDGSADPDANSYVEVDYADDYISTNAFVSAEWAALTDDQKEALLIRSSKYIDTYVRWNGERVDEDSGLRWPRSGVMDQDGFEFADDTIPLILQDAVCEFASYLMTTDWTAPQGTYAMKEIKVDVIEIQYDTKISTRPSMPDFVIQMLSDLGVPAKSTKPNFRKIVRQ
jgi:hypothetical protein